MSVTSSILSPDSIRIAQQYPVRKTKGQKQAFQKEVASLLTEKGWQVETQHTGRFVKSTNIVVGNPSAAKAIFTAHYDTPATLPFPNFIAPSNLFITLVYQALLGFAAVLPGLVTMAVVSNLTGSFFASWLALMLCFGGIFYLLINGPANPSNANDNTSGVLVLLETALHLPEELRNQVAFVFFDNEEKGLLGSTGFSNQHRRLENTPILNFDCVGEGDTIAFCFNRGSRKDSALLAAMQTSFQPSENKQVQFLTSPFVLYPSDQMVFSKGIGIAALRKRFLLGFSIDKIHTKKDTVLQPENILLLRQGCCHFASNLPSSS